MAVWAGVFAAGAASALMAYAVRGRSSTLFGSSVYRGPRRQPVMALTFDDGPSPGSRRLLEVLAAENVPGTFFQCGANVERHPDVAREIVCAGHEIGNHSYSHPLFSCRRPGFVEDELVRAQEVIQQVTQVTPRLFRAPYGVRWFGLRAAQERLGLLGVMWTVVARDWRLCADGIVDRVMAGTGNGAIVCLHDGRELHTDPDIRNTVEGVRRLIPLLRDRGFEFATVSALLCRTN